MASHESLRAKTKSLERAAGAKKGNYVVFRIESFGNKTAGRITDKKDLPIKKRSVLHEPTFTSDGSIFFPEGVGVQEPNT